MTHEALHPFVDTTVPNTLTRDHLSIWYRNWTTRRAFRRVAPELLEDLGFTQEQRTAEIAKPFWR
ncbi:MAG: hypothetical protein ACSHXW_19070 [Yoonia sp.]|jgi:uncharacterized protein YjiS (DUF1127 family)